MTGNVTSPDIDFHIYFFSSKALLHHIDDATGLSGKTLLPLERIWLGRYIPTHWYIRNSGYLTYMQIVYLSKCGVYHFWALWLVVRLRSRLDTIGLLPCDETSASSLDSQVVARWWRPKAGKPMATELDGYTSWKLWFWYTIRCMRARLRRVESGVDKEVYLVHWQYISGVRYWASNDKGLKWRIQSIWNNP